MDVLSVLKNMKDDVDFENSKDFIEDVLLDSHDIVTLVWELEEAFGIEIGARDIVPENFVSLESIEKLVKKYQ